MMSAVANLAPFKINQPASQDTLSKAASGRVVLVGAGPGDPDLLTLKALRVIQTADIILYDRLVSRDIRALFPATTSALYVGKSKGHHCVPQAELNQLLIDKAQAGLTVCRLKGGDAFVFGRGAEEMLALKQAGIPVDVVPGITAASGCSAYAGIPLTHRSVAQGCTFVTGHAEKTLDIDWASLAELKHTLVFYMGLSSASAIQNNLLANGLVETTPVALIENGCCDNQRVITGTLNTFVELIATETVQSPALIVIGDVVALANDLAWFDPLIHNSKDAVLNSAAIFGADVPTDNQNRLSA